MGRHQLEEHLQGEGREMETVLVLHFEMSCTKVCI